MNKNRLKKFTNKNGITLITLIITIVLLIILAGVAINISIGNIEKMHINIKCQV